MKNSLNIFHYSIYLMHCKLHLISNKINPFRLLHKPPFQKRKYQQLGIDIDEEINNVFINKEFGLNTIISGGIIFGIGSILLMSLTKVFMSILKLNTSFNEYFFLAFGGISYALCYYLVFRNDKYLEYFKEYEKWTRKETKKYVWISLGFIIGVIALFFMSLLMFN